MAVHPSTHPIDSYIRQTEKGAALDVRIYVRPAGDANIVALEEGKLRGPNMPVANEIQLMEHLLYTITRLYKAAKHE